LKGFDVVIIGGGLSGSSTALNLSKKGYSVLIIEKEKFQNYKPCAGGMASSMQRFLPLDIEDSIESKIKNVEFRWKASDNVTADLTGESPFWIIKREKLDQFLLDESLSNGAQIMRPLLIEKIIKKNDKWEITCNNKIKYISVKNFYKTWTTSLISGIISFNFLSIPILRVIVLLGQLPHAP